MFEHKPQNRVPVEEAPETAYRRAQQEFTTTVGTSRAAAANWRLMAFCLLLVTVGSLGAAYYFANRSTVVPYIVEVDSRSGALISTSKVYDRSQANKQETEYFVWQIVKKARTLPKDVILYESNWNDVYCFLDSKASQKFNDMATREKHKEKLSSGVTTMLDLKSITPLAGQEDTYNVRWHETRYENDGSKGGEYELEAYFSMTQAPVDEKTVYINPLGLKVRDFSISQVQ